MTYYAASAIGESKDSRATWASTDSADEAGQQCYCAKADARRYAPRSGVVWRSIFFFFFFFLFDFVVTH